MSVEASLELIAPFDLTGQVAIVTGSTRGIGLAIAKAFCQEGAKCVISSESSEDVELTIRRLADKGYDVLGVTCDVTKDDDQISLIHTTLRHFGQIDILVCNAGVTGKAGPLTTSNPDDDLQVFDTNLHSMVTLAKAAYPTLRTQSSASIILMSSIAGLRGNAVINAYALAKAGVAQLARNLAVQWGPDNIRVNAISPGLIETTLAQPLTGNRDFLERRLQMTPLRRLGQVEDVAGCALFLASDAASFVTGHNLIVDGGTTITDGS
ncbi:short-chain dehydrogenase [Litorimonas cladophorae]|uniref:Short-chain dehydrogenase n=1 Tax=Litorimonas cladophorae TaxID=1220491 RepID=A0A918KIQ1_9PROT|nr:SDR family oxidoreductase [Litorimonas cladophorae]GGX63229.1 short-chain dehydrogenase [Litorimonas cladophorae]